MSQVLQDERHEKLIQANLIIQKAQGEGRDLTTGETVEVDKLITRAGRIKNDPSWIDWGNQPQDRITAPCDPLAGCRPPDNPTSFLNPSPNPCHSHRCNLQRHVRAPGRQRWFCVVR